MTSYICAIPHRLQSPLSYYPARSVGEAAKRGGPANGGLRKGRELIPATGPLRVHPGH